MASLLYTHHREEALSAVASGTLKVFAVSDSYTPNAAHTSINDVTAGARRHTSVTLGSVTVTGGELDAADMTLTAVTATACAINAIIVYTEAGSSASSTLHVYLEVTPVTPNGGDIILQWAGSTPFIYKL